MKTTVAVLATVAALILGLVIVSTVVAQLDPVAQAEAARQAAQRTAQREALAPWLLALKQVGVVTLMISLIAGAAGAVAFAKMVWARAAKERNQASMVYAEHGLYPAVVQKRNAGMLEAGLPANRAWKLGAIRLANSVGLAAAPDLELLPPPNEPRAQMVAALVGGNVDRIPTGAMRPLLRPTPDEALLPDSIEPDGGAAIVPLETALRVDPHDPHWLLIGGTGAGKSRAIYNILEQLNRQARCEMLICEVDGTDWNHLAAADTLDGYLGALEAVEVERQRRIALLRAADVAHISELAAAPPYLVLVLEEAESVYGNMDRLGRDAAKRFTNLMRDFASMGRKQGIMLIVATQTGTSQVFDTPTRKNFGHRFLFRSEPIVGDAWGLPRSVGLPGLPSGTAYDLAHGGLVAFPLVARPARLPMSPLYRNNSLDGAVSGVVQDTVYRPEGGVWEVDSGIPAVIPAPVPIVIPPTIVSPAELTPLQRRRIWAIYRQTGSIRAVERALWPDIQHGGSKFYVVREVVASHPRSHLRDSEGNA